MRPTTFSLLLMLPIAACSSRENDTRFPTSGPFVTITPRHDTTPPEARSAHAPSGDEASASANRASVGSVAAPTSIDGAPHPEGPTPGGSQALADTDILDIARTANASEIAQGEIAIKRAKNARVKRFAELMVKEHTEADALVKDVAQQSKLTPTANFLSTTLASDGTQTLSLISVSKVAEFDRVYIDAEVKDHLAMLQLFDQLLVPNARAREVKELVATVRQAVEEHLKEARSIQQSLPSP